MALAWNEIKDRALAFSREWAQAESENADAKPFWIEFSDQPATRHDYEARREKELIRERTADKNRLEQTKR